MDIHPDWFDIEPPEGYTQEDMREAIQRAAFDPVLDMHLPPDVQDMQLVARAIKQGQLELQQTDAKLRSMIPKVDALGYKKVTTFLVNHKYEGDHKTFLDPLANARVIVFDSGQMNALPQSTKTETEAWLQTLDGFPFTDCFFDVGTVDLGGLGQVGHQYSFLVSDGWFTAWSHKSGQAEAIPLFLTRTGGEYVWLNVNTSPETLADEHVMDDFVAILCERLMAAVRLLECTNVELEEQAVSRQARKQAKRKGYRLPLVIKIKQTRRASSSTSAGKHIDFTHRFEVRGHYKHFGPDTRLYQASPPEKRIELADRGSCVRLWCPPFVKGPEHLPLIPKRREVVQ